MSGKIKRRVAKKHRHRKEKWRKANMVYVYEKPIERACDLCAVVTAVYTARPRTKGAWGLHYRHAPRVIDYRDAWDWYSETARPACD